MDKTSRMLSKFKFTFSWKYIGDGDLHSLLPDVFQMLEQEDERSLEQILIGCVHQARPGLTLWQPESNPDVPYEMEFVVHPPHESFSITKIVFLSEARNLELYINGGYEKSTRGIMLTLNNLNKDRKSSLFEAQFDLSGYIQTKSNATIKFLSYPCKACMKIQAVVMKVEQCKPISSFKEQFGASVNLSSVKRFLGSVGRPLSNDAQKMLHSIENYQKSPAYKAQQMLSSQAGLLQNVAWTRGKEAAKQIAEDEEKAINEEQYDAGQTEHDQQFMSMLNQLSLTHEQTSSTSPRASKTTSSHDTLVTTSFEGHLGIIEDKTTAEHSSRKCKACGCPGCIAVFDTISTNIFAAEKRILEKVDNKMTQLREDLDRKFQLLYQLLDRIIDNEQD